MMDTALVSNIDFTTNNKEIITVSPNNFSNFYIANIDDAGDEKNYDIISETKTLLANFFMIRLKKENNQESFLAHERLSSRKDIIKVTIHFINGISQDFDLAKKRVVKDGKLENICEEIFYLEEDLCIIISDKKIKYAKNLFV